MEKHAILYIIKRKTCYQDFVTKSGKQIRVNIGLHYIATVHYSNLKEMCRECSQMPSEVFEADVFINDSIEAINECQLRNDQVTTELLNLLDDDFD